MRDRQERRESNRGQSDIRKNQESLNKKILTATGFELPPREQFTRATGIGEVFALFVYARLSKFVRSQI